MYLVMCPAGAEGTSYAMLTTLTNLSATVAYRNASSVENCSCCSVAAGFANIWDVSNSTLADHEYDGMWKLTVLYGAIQIIPLAFIWRQRAYQLLTPVACTPRKGL